MVFSMALIDERKAREIKMHIPPPPTRPPPCPPRPSSPPPVPPHRCSGNPPALPCRKESLLLSDHQSVSKFEQKFLKYFHPPSTFPLPESG